MNSLASFDSNFDFIELNRTFSELPEHSNEYDDETIFHNQVRDRLDNITPIY